jgi:immune inhibitor A
MNSTIKRAFLIITLFLLVAVPIAGAAPGDQDDIPDGLDPTFRANTDNPSHPLGDAKAALREKAFAAQMKGEVSGPVAEVAKGQFVELERLGEDTIWTVLGEFGDLESPIGILQGGAPGPQHNQIPEPDRSVDNSTIWAPDFSESYYEELLFSEAPGTVSMRNYYIEQSSNRYTVNGDVSDWGQVPYRAAHYGRDWCGSIVCGQTTWWFVRDSVNAWYQAQLAAGMTAADIDAYLSQYDVWDRYDFDGDGNFDEPDGYIDHFQSVHAGEGQETGGGSYGSDAIWSHRWYVQLVGIGSGGPTLDDGTVVPFGGTPVGGSSRYWIGDYTIEPENGGVGVFAHEFGHDLDLPDLYDTSGNTGGAENSTAFWTLMSSGSYGNSGIPADGIGSKPIPMSAYEKIFLGWSNYEVIDYGQKASVKLGPSNYNTKQAQQLVLLLPDKEVDFEVGDPYSGDYFYFSGSGNDLDNSMTREFALPAGSPMLTAKVNFDIEVDWDYAYLEVNGTPVHTNFSTNNNPNGQNFGEGITGSSGGWADLTADLSAFAGQTVTIGFRYWTDGAVVGDGMFVDNIQVSGSPLDDAETDFGWAHNGFIRTGSIASQSFFNAYFAEFRTYKGYDDGLRTGPYNFGFLNSDPNWVEHFSYQDGLLVWYYDESFADNSVGDNCASGRCGGGLYLPVDAHPNIELWSDGTVMRPRIQSYDSTFGLEPTEEITVHMNGQPTVIESKPAVPIFDDTNDYWSLTDSNGNDHSGERYIPGYVGVNVPKTGTTIRVVSVSAQGNFMQVHVNK